MSNKALQHLGISKSGKGKVFGFLFLVAALVCIVHAPLESAHFVGHVIGSAKTFFSSF